MQQIYQQLASKLTTEDVFLATVIDIKGSTPREIGAKMLIYQDGEIFGTIGGGAGEAKVCQVAASIYENRLLNKSIGITKSIVEIDLSGAVNRATEGVCGGTMMVLLELWSGENYLNLAQQILDLYIANQRAVMITSLLANQIPYLITESTNKISINSPQIDTDNFIEPITITPTLLIIGAGHVAVPLAKIAAMSGFRIVIQDDRPELANSQRFPDAWQIFTGDINSLLPILATTEELYIALVNRGYVQDITSLKVILLHQYIKYNHHKYNQPIKYIGMIGSRKRVQTVYQKLTQELANESELKNLDLSVFKNLLENIHAPIGLDIGALTPTEIAVSICAELIKIRRRGENSD